MLKSILTLCEIDFSDTDTKIHCTVHKSFDVETDGAFWLTYRGPIQVKLDRILTCRDNFGTEFWLPIANKFLYIMRSV